MLDLGCERIICLCETPRPSILGLQQEVEARGAEFHIVKSNLQIVALVRAADELVMLADGLLPDRDFMKDHWLIAGKPARAIATIPADHQYSVSHPDEFERIDRDQCWAGVAALPANQVHKLADMPPDGDPISILLRLALQAGVECRDMAGNGLSDENWIVASDPKMLAARQTAILEGCSAQVTWAAPTHALAAQIVRGAGLRLLGSGAQIALVTGVALMLGGVALAFPGFGSVAVGLAALGSGLITFGDRIADLRKNLWPRRNGWLARDWTEIAVDLLALTCLLGAQIASGESIAVLSLPVFAIGLARLNFSMGGSVQFWHDRTLHLFLFAIASGIGHLNEAIALFGLLGLAHLLLRKHGSLG